MRVVVILEDQILEIEHMKKIALVLSIVASALVLASCANKGTEQPTVVSTDNNAKVVAVPAKHHRHHHNYKGEAAAQ